MSSFNPNEYWNQRIKSIGGHQATGRQDLPEIVNKQRKTRLFSTLDRVYREHEVDLQNSRILDAGCGNGAYSEYYSDRGAEVTGVDFSESAIEQIHQRDIPGEFFVNNIDSLPQTSDSFDIVHCFSVLYHLVDDNWSDAISELTRVLKPGGYILLRIEWVNEEFGAGEHVRFRPKSRYQDLLHEAGVDVVQTYSIYDDPRLATISTHIPQLLSLDAFWRENQEQKLVLGRMERN